MRFLLWVGWVGQPYFSNKTQNENVPFLHKRVLECG